MDKAMKFEAKFLEILREEMKQRKLTHKGVAEQAFASDQSKPDNKMYRLLKPNSKTGKNQRVTLADAYILVSLIKYSLPDFLFRVQKELEHDEEKLSRSKFLPEAPEVRPNSA
jgi:hypothetical protein